MIDNATEVAQHAINLFCNASITRLNDRIPTLLYHYTKPGSLKGIFESGCFLVNEISHLNDTAELRYAAAVLRAHVDRMRASEREDGIVPLFDALQTRLSSVDFSDVYILSLVANADDRHMWSLYADRERGVSLVMEAVDHVEWGNGWVLLRCRYGDAEISEFCRHALSLLRAIYADTLTRHEPLSPDQLAKMFLMSVRWFAPAFKISSWADENEWRLVRFGPPSGIERGAHPSGRKCIKAPSVGRMRINAVCLGPLCNSETALKLRRRAHETGYGGTMFYHSQHALAEMQQAIDNRMISARPEDGKWND